MTRAVKISKRNIIIFCFALIAFLVAVLQPFGYSPDFKQYEFFFDQVRQYSEEIRTDNRFEPGFFYASFFLSQIFLSDVVLYGVFVTIAILIKLHYSFKDARGYYFWLGILFYFIKFFPLLELTQLRAALGASFMIAAFSYSVDKYFVRFSIASVLAALFHYSSLMVAPLLFLPRMKRWQAIALALISFLMLSILSEYLVGIAGSKFSVFETYGDFSFSSRPLNRLSPVFFPEFFMILCSLIFWRELNATMQRIVSIEMIGFSLFYAFIDYGVVAVRGREFFSILWLFFVVHGNESSKNIRSCLNIFVFSSVALYFYIFFASDFFVGASQWME